MELRPCVTAGDERVCERALDSDAVRLLAVGDVLPPLTVGDVEKQAGGWQ